jgi:cell division protein ZapA
MEAKSVRLRIYGQEYPLRVDNEELTTESARRLDKMMTDLHTQIPDQPPVTLAVLSALNLAEDLSHEQEDKRQILSKVEQEVRSIADLLDGAVG